MKRRNIKHCCPRHHSAPIPNSISEEAMEVEPTAIVTVPTSKTADFAKIEAACLELIEESKERSPSKERSKTPLISEYQQSREPMSIEGAQICEINQKASNEQDKSQQKRTKSLNKNLYEDVVEKTASESMNKIANEIAFNKKSDNLESKVPNKSDTSVTNETPQDIQQFEPTENEFKKLKEKALSLEFSELSNEVANAPPVKLVERRRSKIFETAEKFNQLSSTAENEKPKKIFIPGVNVGGAKRAFERKASLSAITPPPTKVNASKVIIDVPTTKTGEKDEQKQALGNQEIIGTEDKLNTRDEAKKRAIDIISGAIGKPPMQKKLNGSPPSSISPQSPNSKKLGLKIQVAPNDMRSATVSVSTPIETKFDLDVKSMAPEATVSTKLKCC